MNWAWCDMTLSQLAIGVDVGATKVAAILADDCGHVTDASALSGLFIAKGPVLHL